jgi:hypothetical protein
MNSNDLLTLSQRLREYNHNPHHINPVSDAFHKLITESAEALSQFAAIQGGMGEEVEVVATLILGGIFYGSYGHELCDNDIEPRGSVLDRLQSEIVDSADDVQLDLMTVAQHQRITDALRGEVERLKDALETESMRLAACGVAALGYFDGCAEAYESASLRDVLALRAQPAEQPSAAKVRVPCKLHDVFEEADFPPNYAHGWNECVDFMRALNGKTESVPSAAKVPEGWIPVTERLPEVAQEVIVSTEFEGVCAGILDSYGEWFAPCSEYKLTRVTHWMPLPSAPEVV